MIPKSPKEEEQEGGEEQEATPKIFHRPGPSSFWLALRGSQGNFLFVDFKIDNKRPPKKQGQRVPTALIYLRPTDGRI